MKNGTLYAGRLKKAYTRQRQAVQQAGSASSQPVIPETIQQAGFASDPFLCLATAVLAEESTEAEAKRAVDRILASMVDWNEVRVSDCDEINRASGNTIRHGARRCKRLIDALQSVYEKENRLSLDRLKSVGRREARQYLEELDGVSEYAVAFVLLWSLGGHAIPVNDRLLTALRDADLVFPTASRAEVQAFLERHVSASDGKRFCIVMRSFSPKKAAVAKKRAAPKTTQKKKKAKTR